MSQKKNEKPSAETATTTPPVAAALSPEQLEELKTRAAKADESWERLLRTTADFDNFKKRSRQESEARAAAQKESLIAELLPVIDNLERASAAGVSRDSAQFHKGVEMTLKQLQQLLRQHGVVSEEIIGKPFDPHRHEALSQGHDPAKPDHAILEVVQRGYLRGAKVVRPAKVIVNDLTASQPARHGR